ncbi:hypothetical protein Btru_043890 [Bulinus truncatus]|nr:hypothetical protein Btru_043890 [Bulinus truncatus]
MLQVNYSAPPLSCRCQKSTCSSAHGDLPERFLENKTSLLSSLPRGDNINGFSHCYDDRHVLNSCNRRLDRVEILNRLNGNYNCSEISYCPRSGHCCCNDPVHQLRDAGHGCTQLTRAELRESIVSRTEAYWRSSSRHASLVTPSKCTLPPDIPFKSLTNIKCGHVDRSRTSSNTISNTQYQYQIRRQQRSRKFRLNLSMYSALYRKHKKVENNYIIYHNPMEDNRYQHTCPVLVILQNV